MRSLAEPQRRALTEVLALMREGERVAAECASRQAALIGSVQHQRFLRAQARQEQFHATIFDLGLRALHARDWNSQSSNFPVLSKLRQRLDRDLASGDIPATVVGFQIVLEGLGQAVLAELDAAMSSHGWGMERLRRVLRKQEDVHHAFGVAYFEAKTPSHPRLPSTETIGEYLCLGRRQLEECQELCHALDLEPAELSRRFEYSLPTWLRAASS